MKKKLTNAGKIVSGIILALGLALAGFIVLYPRRRRIVVLYL